MNGVRQALGRRAAIMGAALANTGRPLAVDARSVSQHCWPPTAHSPHHPARQPDVDNVRLDLGIEMR
jgi:hypothetical protein